MIDLPKDIVIGQAPYAAPAASHPSYRPRTEPDLGQIAKAVALLKAGEAADDLCRRRRHQLPGRQAAAALTKFVRMTGFPVTNTLMGLGAYPASDPQFLGMLGMHGTYEANLAMHGCDVLLAVGARFDDRVTGRLNAFSQGSREDPRRHRRVVDQQERAGRGADRGRCRPCAGCADRRVASGQRPSPTTQALASWWRQIDAVAGEGEPEIHPGHDARRDHQAAIRHPAAVSRLTRAVTQGHLHHHRGRPAPDVGRAALPLREAEPLDDLAAAWARWAMACPRRWACRSRIRMRW